MAGRVEVPSLGVPRPLDRHQAAHIPGRKLAQIGGMAGALADAGDAPHGHTIVDWCGGRATSAARSARCRTDR
ncbi:MAG: hypothetical protein U1F43_34590 [Myxococcota bacterium]